MKEKLYFLDLLESGVWQTLATINNIKCTSRYNNTSRILIQSEFLVSLSAPLKTNGHIAVLYTVSLTLQMTEG